MSPIHFKDERPLRRLEKNLAGEGRKAKETIVAIKIAYADPPYIGQAERHYSHDPNCAEVDHTELITRLLRDYDGWALSLSAPSLWQIARLQSPDGSWLVPENAHIGSWVKPWASFKPNVNPAFVWEPVIFYGGRKRGRNLPTLRDWVSANATLQKGLAGAKPPKVCYWIFEMLGAQPGDDFHDLYPGTGIVTRAWENFSKQTRVKDLPLWETQ